ncbi:MAG: sugar phosphate isomerase/epimerase [Bryobacterales bacterium]|nr:sugar phosphate isomerase/epimerase [Bryobacterales bacterium]
MRHAISTHLFVNQRLSTALLSKIQDAGIGLVELFCARQHLDYRNDDQIRELALFLKDVPLMTHSIHLPMFSDDCWGKTGPHSVIDIASPSKAKRIAAVDEAKRALDLAGQIPFSYAIQHIGVGFDEEWSMHKVDAAFDSLDELNSFAKQRGVEVLVENIPNALSSAKKMVEFFEATHLKLGVCLDVGHANMMEGFDEAFDLLQDRIRSLHVHDNNGQDDKHLFPRVHEGGTVDWQRTMTKLRALPESVPLLLELKEDPGMANPLDRVKEVFEELEKLS